MVTALPTVEMASVTLPLSRSRSRRNINRELGRSTNHPEQTESVSTGDPHKATSLALSLW